MSDDDHKSQHKQDHDDIPELTREIPTVDQAIPELTQSIPEVTNVIPELTQRLDSDEHTEAPVMESETDSEVQTHSEVEAASEVEIGVASIEKVSISQSYPIMPSQVSDKELEMQQWLIEEQAREQIGEWHELANVTSSRVTSIEPTTDKSSAEEQDEEQDQESGASPVNLSDEQQAILTASWQRLESMLMEQMPPEVAGIYMTLLEKQFNENQQQIAESLSLLEQDTIDNLLDYFKIDLGF